MTTTLLVERTRALVGRCWWAAPVLIWVTVIGLTFWRVEVLKYRPIPCPATPAAIWDDGCDKGDKQ